MPLTITSQPADGFALCKFTGAVDEYADQAFLGLLSVRERKVVLDLGDVTSITSMGVRIWLNFMQNFRQTHEVTLKNCPAEIIMQINMIPAFLGSAKVESFSAPFYCPGCKKAFYKTLQVYEPYMKLVGDLQTQACDACENDCDCEESPDDYLRFLRPK